MTTPTDPFELFAEPTDAPVTRDRILPLLNGEELDMAATAHPDDEVTAMGRLNQLDWFIASEGELVKVECVLPTALDYELVAPVFAEITNEVNASAFDGRALVGDVDGSVELRGDATFVTAAGMNDDQLFHALNLAVLAAQEALLSTLDTFNEFANGVAARDPGAVSDSP